MSLFVSAAINKNLGESITFRRGGESFVILLSILSCYCYHISCFLCESIVSLTQVHKLLMNTLLMNVGAITQALTV